MQIDLSIHSVLFQAIKNAFNLNNKRPIKLPRRRISPRKINPTTNNLFSIILSKISQRNSFRKALRITNQLTIRIFRIFISSAEKENTLATDVRRSFHSEINSSCICEEIIVKSSLLSPRKRPKHRLLFIKKFRILLLTRLQRL